MVLQEELDEFQEKYRGQFKVVYVLEKVCFDI